MDYLVRIITKTENIRALACLTTGLVDEARRRHGTWPTASTAMGMALSGGVLLGALLKTDQRVALRFEGNGPLQKILVEADSNGAVRGSVAVPKVHTVTAEGELDVPGALGRAGFLTVTKDLGLKAPYESILQLYNSEIAGDLALYLTESEQIPSAIGLGVFVEPDNHVSAAGGFLIQSLPPANEQLIEMLMGRITEMPPITQLLHEGTTPEEILELLFAGIEYLTLEKRELAFRCSCSRQKIERVLLSMGREELTEILQKEEGTEVTCEFCREVYSFNRGELEQLVEELDTLSI